MGTGTIFFTKVCGAGNDFVVVDNRRAQIPERRLKRFARAVCERKRGVGADGLLVLEKSRRADFRMRIFNPDGTEPDMCGNGARCIARYARDRRIARDSMVFETGAGLISAGVKGERVKLLLSDPQDLRLNLKVRVGKHPFTVSHINTGVPHVVVFVNTLEGIDVRKTGAALRYHPLFRPAGTNVNFVRVEGRNAISIRTYERGVEDETLACGTGSTASALIASLIKRVVSPVRVGTRGGDVLKVYFSREGERFSGVYLEGKVQNVFEGVIGGNGR